MTVTTLSPTALLWIDVNDAARRALSSAVKPTVPALPAQFLGEGHDEHQQFEVVLGYYRWHVRITLATRLHETGTHYEAVLTAAYREASAATSPGLRVLHQWKGLTSKTISNRRATEQDVDSFLAALRHDLEHQPDVIAWVFRRRPY